uniref:Core-2/I-Branching enzyme n=1 Tax=Parascaris equorum TaxID=6256 RepID=A0A914RWW8_PAREQ
MPCRGNDEQTFEKTLPSSDVDEPHLRLSLANDSWTSTTQWPMLQARKQFKDITKCRLRDLEKSAVMMENEEGRWFKEGPPILEHYAVGDKECKRAINDEKFASIIAKDYHLQELFFNLMYSPENIFCYAIDRKASIKFHQQMRNLSYCFPNIYLTKTEYDVDSAGHNMDQSFLECLQTIRHLPNWKYAILLQNHDIPLKTNREVIAILQSLNGTNDVSISRPIANRNDNRIFKIAKGSTAGSLSRAFVEFILDKLNLTTILKRFSKVHYGMDEMIIPSLNSDDGLDAPGGFTRRCINRQSSFITRYVVWGWSRLPCKSGRYRHSVCVFGIEDLRILCNSRYLFANKMLAENDYFAISCWAKILHNRTHNHDGHRHIDVEFYSLLPSVRFNKNRQKWRANLKAFNC